MNKAKILIVDDEASICRVAGRYFNMRGYDVATAGDGEEALEVYNKFSPDLVILDIIMPRLDGYGVIRELRKSYETPIIILTTLGNATEHITGLKLGANAYFVKPFSPKDVEAKMQELLRRKIVQKEDTETKNSTYNINIKK